MATCTVLTDFLQIESCATKIKTLTFNLVGTKEVTVALGGKGDAIFDATSELKVTSTTGVTIESITVSGDAKKFNIFDFDGLTKIETIDLKKCQLQRVAEIKSTTTNDVTLDLSKNEFSDFTVKLTGTFDKKLKTLRLNDNKFTTIKSELYARSGLKTLYMANNPITEVKASAATTLGDGVTTSITYLSLRGNTNPTLPTGLCNPPDLTEIDLTGATVGKDETLSKWLLDDVKTCVGRGLTIHAPSDKFDCDCTNLIGLLKDTKDTEKLTVDTCNTATSDKECPSKDLKECENNPGLESPFTKKSVDQACSGVRVPPCLFVMGLSFVFTLLYK